MIEIVEYPRLLDKIEMCLTQIKRKHYGIAKWEIRFLNNIKRQVEDNNELMESQQLKLADIFNRLYRPTKGEEYES